MYGYEIVHTAYIVYSASPKHLLAVVVRLLDRPWVHDRQSSQVGLLQTAHCWANAGVLLGVRMSWG